MVLKKIKKWTKRKKRFDVEYLDQFRKCIKEDLEYAESKHLRGDNVEMEWNALKDIILKSAEKNIPEKRANQKKPWITNEILQLIDERRKWKNVQTVEGKRNRQLNNKLKRDDVVLRHTLPVFTGLGRCPIVNWDFAGAVSIFGPDALPVVHQ